MSGLQISKPLFDLKNFGGKIMQNINKERKWIIYMYTFPNDKRYIGKTSRSLKERQESSDWIGYRSSTVLYRAINKYGVDNIKQDILIEDYMTDAQSSELEMYYISLYKTNCCRYKNPSYGYNTTDGGEGSTGFKQTEEAKEKTRQARLGKIGNNANSSKSVFCIELNKTFAGAAEAERETGVSRKSISQCVRKCSKSTTGGNTEFKKLHWILSEKICDAEIDLILNTPSVVRKKKSVYCVELNKVFNSAEDAHCEGYGAENKIRYCCSHHKSTTKTQNGIAYHWMYADDIDEDEVKLITQRMLTNSQQKLIYCVELNRYFVSIRQAERDLGLTHGCVNFALKHGTTTSGPNNERLHWAYVNKI